jgi:hypothetical protein
MKISDHLTKEEFYVRNNDKNKSKNINKIDYLSEDPEIYDQKWYCASFISPEGIMNTNIRGLKIRGSYSTKEEAEKRADYLRSIDSNFDIFIGQVGFWCPLCPDPNDSSDQNYKEAQLQELVKREQEMREKNKQTQEERKKELARSAKRSSTLNDQNNTRNQDARNKLAKKYEKEKKLREQNLQSRNLNEEPVLNKMQNKNDDLDLPSVKKSLDEIDDDIYKQELSLDEIDAKIKEIEKLRKNIINKK